MKAWKRVLVKVLVLLLIVLLFGGGAACLRAYQQSTPDYAMEQYLGRLIENDADRAYTLLDQSQDTPITSQEYAAALEARKYSLYSEYELARSAKDISLKDVIDVVEGPWRLTRCADDSAACNRSAHDTCAFRREMCRISQRINEELAAVDFAALAARK